MIIDFSRFKAAIFDLDGTLANSNTVWEKLDRKILDKYNIPADDDFVKALASLTYEEAADELRKKGVPLSDEDFTIEINTLAEMEYASCIELKPFSIELLHHLKKLGLRIILATGSPKRLYEPLLKRFDVYKLFDGFITTDEVGKSKDFPDIYEKAAEIANVKLNQCIIFEDTLNAVKTAAGTEAFVCGVFDEYSEKYSSLIAEYSDTYVHSFDKLL